MGKKDSVAGILLIALFGAAYAQALTFQERSAAFPKIICLAGIALSIILTIRGFVGKDKTEGKPMFTAKQKKMILIMLALIVVYAVLIDIVGFVISTVVFMIVAGFVLYPDKISAENRKPAILIVAVALITTLLIWYVFKNLLYVPLPAGKIFG